MVYALLRNLIQTIIICLSVFQWFYILFRIPIFHWLRFRFKKKNRQTTKEHSLMSKKDSHKKTDQNADQKNQMNEMDENFSGRFCK